MHKCTWFKPNIVLMIFSQHASEFFPPFKYFDGFILNHFFSLSLFIIICQLFFNCLTNFPRKILISALFERTLNLIAMQNRLIEFRWDWVVLFFGCSCVKIILQRKNLLPVENWSQSICFSTWTRQSRTSRNYTWNYFQIVDHVRLLRNCIRFST